MKKNRTYRTNLQNERLSRDDACRVFPGRNDLVSV